MPGVEEPTPAGPRKTEDALEIGARLLEPPSPAMVKTAFAAELGEGRALAAELGLADLAHTVMSIETGIVPPGPGGALLKALLELQSKPEMLPGDPELGNLYTNREAWLSERTDAAGWLGSGRARREANTVAYLLAVRARLLELTGAAVELGRALAQRALELKDTLVPDYTYLRAAQPTSLGHTLLATAYGVLRDLGRLRALHQRLDQCPAGCGSANGSRLPQDRRRLSELLGFGTVCEHARDAMWQADVALEAAAVVTAAMVNANRLAEDLLFFGAEEVGLVELADSHSRASRILPQKRNPYALTHVRAIAHRALGAQTAVASAGRTPSGQIDSRLVAYAEVPNTFRAADGALRLLAEVVHSLRANGERGAALLASGQTFATDLAEVLVLEGGLDYRSAHRAVGTLLRELPPGGGRGAVTAERLGSVASRLAGRPIHVSARAVASALDPRQAVLERSGPGGASPEEVQAMAWRCQSALEEYDAWRLKTAQRALGAERRLLECAQSLASLA